MNVKGYFLCTTAAACLYAVMPSIAAAQAAPAAGTADAAPAGLEDIVVTARKRSESLQTTPVAVTALGSDALQQAQVQTVADLSRTTPNLNISTGGAGPASLVFVSIRGQTQNQPGSSADPAVAIYVDGVYYARPTGGDLDMFDVDQAEVLRGPQGTLFGRNTTGGAINIKTKDPTDRLEGKISASIGNLGLYRIEGVANLPLGEDLSARFVGRYTQNDGYAHFARLNGRDAGDVRGQYFARGKLLWDRADKGFSVLLAGDYGDFKSSGQATTTLGINRNLDLGGGFTVGNAFAAVGFDPTPYLTTKDNFRTNYGYADTGFGLDVPRDKNRSYGGSATVNVDLGDDIALKSITAYRTNFTESVLDLDSLPVNMVSFITSYDQKQFSQELQLSGKTGSLEWITGAYFFRESTNEYADSRSFSFLNPAAPLGRGTSGDTRNTSRGLFAQANYHLTDRLRVTAGIRYTWDTRHIVRHPLLDVSTGACAIPSADRDMPGGACNQTQSASFDYPAWTFGIDYKLDDGIFVYAKTSGASMAGGWNLRGNFAPSFSPEKVRDVEAGIKADFLDRRLRLNLAAFHTWQKAAQRIVTGYDPVFQSSTQYVVNSGDVRLYGLEAEATVIPWTGMRIAGNFAYLHSRYVKGTFDEQQVIASTGAVPAGCIAGAQGTIVCTVDRSGERTPFAPKYNASISATQTVPTGFGEISAHLEYVYTSSKVSYALTAASQQSQAYKDQIAEANRLSVIKGYGLLNGVLKADIGDRWEVSIWGRNLTDKKYIQNLSNFYMSFGPVLGVTAPPRTYGATLSLNW